MFQDIKPNASSGHGSSPGPHRHRGEGPRADRQAAEDAPRSEQGARSHQGSEEREGECELALLRDRVLAGAAIDAKVCEDGWRDVCYTLMLKRLNGSG